MMYISDATETAVKRLDTMLCVGLIVMSVLTFIMF